MRKATFLLPALAVILIGFFSAIFIVDEREKALVLQFGRVVTVEEEPGLGFKIPLIQNIVTYDDRIQSLSTEELEVTPLDNRRLLVDAFARWRIEDLEVFREATAAGGDVALATANDRLEGILRAVTREVLGSVTSNVILSEDRATLMARIRDRARVEADDLGIQLIDIRLKRTDLPPENLEATFSRMVTEREQEAEEQRAQGRQRAQEIRALANRTVVEIESAAQREARIIQGEADAQMTAILGEAFGRDDEFFDFYRSLEAYRTGLQNNRNTRMVLSPDHEFLEYLRSSRGSNGGGAQAGQ